MGAPVDLARLKAVAERTDGETQELLVDLRKDAIIERSYLKQILEELTACRDAEVSAGRCFGLPEGTRL